MKREYTTLEFTLQMNPSRKTNLIASYVLSRTYGNYTGLFATDLGLAVPNRATWDYLETLTNAEGPLPNDRTHVLKISGSHRWRMGLSAGAIFSFLSGTPLSEKGPGTVPLPLPVFLSERGSVGRTAWIWDLNLRFAYTLPWKSGGRWNQRLLFDILHVASQREAVVFEEQRLIGSAENPVPNPNYGRALAFQPPMTIRLGTDFAF